jgi:hypothetical protein
MNELPEDETIGDHVSYLDDRRALLTSIEGRMFVVHVHEMEVVDEAALDGPGLTFFLRMPGAAISFGAPGLVRGSRSTDGLGGNLSSRWALAAQIFEEALYTPFWSLQPTLVGKDRSILGRYQDLRMKVLKTS